MQTTRVTDRIRGAGLGVLAVLVAAPAWAQGPSAFSDTDEPEARAPLVFEVHMVDKGPTQFVFEPAEVEVRPGDVVVWVQDGVMPHNVQFTLAPKGRPADKLPTSPFLTIKGQRFELQIDDRFLPGEYEYICTPHVGMGMKGTIRVVASR